MASAFFGSHRCLKKPPVGKCIWAITAGTMLQQGGYYPPSIVPHASLLPIIRRGQPRPLTPSLLPSTSVFIFCLPTPTWTNTHIRSNTNTSAKLRIWARTLSCMPAGCCLHSHMTLKLGPRRRGINMDQTSCSQRPLSGPGVLSRCRSLLAQSALRPCFCSHLAIHVVNRLHWLNYKSNNARPS